MADYDCYPLWEASPGQVGNVDPEDLPISQSLKADILAWADRYDATLNRADPAQSGFSDDSQASHFKQTEKELAQRLRLELGSNYTIIIQEQ